MLWLAKSKNYVETLRTARAAHIFAYPRSAQIPDRGIQVDAVRNYDTLKQELSGKLSRHLLDMTNSKVPSGTFASRMKKDLREAYEQAFKLGMEASGWTGSVEQRDKNWLQSWKSKEYSFLNKFANDMEHGNGTMPYEQRLGMYVQSLDGVYWAGRVATADDHTLIHWRLSPAEHCSGCVTLAANSPYTKANLPTQPGASDTPCLSNCKCFLEFAPFLGYFDPAHYAAQGGQAERMEEKSMGKVLVLRRRLTKAHVHAYDREGPGGQTIHVKDYDTSRQAALADFVAAAHAHKQAVDAAVTGNKKQPEIVLRRDTPQAMPQSQSVPAQQKPVQQKQPAQPQQIPPPRALVQAIQVLRNGGKISQVMSDFANRPLSEQSQVEQWMVQVKHPLAQQSGSAAERFRALAQDLTKKLEGHGKKEKAASKQEDTRPPAEKLAPPPEPQAQKDFAAHLEKQPDGAQFVVPLAPKGSGLVGTWEKVTVGGESFYKKKGGNVYRPAKDFVRFETSIRTQLAEAPQKGKKQESVIARSPEASKPAESQESAKTPTAEPQQESYLPLSSPEKPQRRTLPELKVPQEHLGATVTARTDQGTKVQVQYALVESGQPIVSHDTSFRPNPDFPPELQPRDRQKAASEAQIQGILSKFDPALLGANPKASDGAPIVGPDGIVEVGNGRTLALLKAYQGKMPQAEQYKTWLKENASEFGLNPAEVEQMKQPMLVRVRKTDVDRVEFTQETNKPSAATYSAAEQAKNDSRFLTPALLDSYDPEADAGILAAENRPFVRGFMQHMTPAEVAQLVTDKGALSQAGALRIKNALLSRAYENNDLVEQVSESTESNTRNISSALVAVAPRIASIKSGIESGNLHDLDISKDIAKAAIKFGALKAQGEKIPDYLNQGELGGPELSPIARMLLPIFDQYSRQGSKVKQFLNSYSDYVDSAGNPREGASMFGSAPAPTKEEALMYALKKTQSGDAEPKRKQEGEGMFASLGRRLLLVLKKSKGISYEEESAQIRENKKKPGAHQRHKFKAAQWTHPNAHPRCLLCGDEEPSGGYCEGIQKSVESAGPIPLKTLRAAAKTGKTITFQGIPIRIETAEGQKRKWYDPFNDTKGATTMESVSYGEVVGAPGLDGDCLDVFLGKHEDAPNVYLIMITKPPEHVEPDEMKVFMGYRNLDDAVAQFHLCYSDPRFIGSIKEMSVEEFRAKVQQGEVIKSLQEDGLVKTQSRNPLLVLLRKAFQQFSLFGKEVQQPGSRGGKFYVTKETHHIRYGEQPTLVLKVDKKEESPLFQHAKEEAEKRLAAERTAQPSILHQKERWELTQAEYLATAPKAHKQYLMLKEPDMDPKKGRQMVRTVFTSIHSPGEHFESAHEAHIGGHRALIEQAQKEGRTIPEHVLADYPELRQKEKPATEKKPSLFNKEPPGGWTDADKVPASMRGVKTVLAVTPKKKESTEPKMDPTVEYYMRKRALRAVQQKPPQPAMTSAEADAMVATDAAKHEAGAMGRIYGMVRENVKKQLARGDVTQEFHDKIIAKYSPEQSERPEKAPAVPPPAPVQEEKKEPEQDKEPQQPIKAETPATPSIGHFVRNHETDKLHLHFSKTSWNALPGEHKKDVKSNFLWAPSQGAWVSRAKLNNAWRAEQVAKTIGLEDRGHEGEKVSFAEQKEAEAERASERSDRLRDAAAKHDKTAEHLQADFNSKRGDIAYLTQPFTDNSGGRAFKRQVERTMAKYERGFEEQNTAAELRERAATAERTASQDEEKNPAFLQRRIDEAATEMRDVDRRLPQATSGEHASEEWAGRLKEHREKAQEKHTYYSARLKNLQAQGIGGHSKETIKAGDVVKVRGRTGIVQRANDKTISFQDGTFPWPSKYNYAEIQEHKPAASDEERKRTLARLSGKTADPSTLGKPITAEDIDFPQEFTNEAGQEFKVKNRWYHEAGKDQFKKTPASWQVEAHTRIPGGTWSSGAKFMGTDTHKLYHPKETKKSLRLQVLPQPNGRYRVIGEHHA